MEMLVAVVVFALVISLGVPSFRSLSKAVRLSTQANDFISSATFARSEAVKRGERVRISANAGGGGVNEWGKGWKIWVDTDGNGVMTASDEVLMIADAFKNSDFNSLENVMELEYLPTGYINGINRLSFELCQASGNKGKKIIARSTGRIDVDSNFVCS